MTANANFLPDLLPRPWAPQQGHGIESMGLFVGKGANAMEVVVASATSAPARGSLLDVWKTRRAGRASPVLLVVLHEEGAALCGASGETPPVHRNVDRAQAERLSRELLDQPDRHAALRFLAQALPSLDTLLPGINNEGLVALHELQYGARSRGDWDDVRGKAASAVGCRGRDLVRSLGYRVERLDNLTFVLLGGQRRTALAVMLRQDELPEAGAARFNNISPVSYALAKADDHNLPWVVVVQGNRLRLYSTALDAGVGRRGRTETFVECQPTLLADRDLPYLWLLFSAEALAPRGSLSQILEDSHRFAGHLAERLRGRIYEEVVPTLAHGVASARGLDSTSPRDEVDRAYAIALTVLFRLLFIAYAEDRDLLPYRYNDAYRRRSLKQKAQELADAVHRGTPIAGGESHWNEVRGLWQAVSEGNSEWGVPVYNGGLFSDDPEVSLTGATLATLPLPNDVFEKALRALLVTDTAEGVPGPVDFRSLGVREFGTIYEGLLESELAIATTDLTVNRRGSYVPARKRDEIVVHSGHVYLHDRSGARKSSGSYYTKPFAVEHLLDGALEPALADHFGRLCRMDETDAATALFDFRVADIAMGSGHFLIAAIDRIERRMADYLANHDMPGVRRQLADLRNAANVALGEHAGATIIEDGQLLRRMIARRCIYGVDTNHLTVQLARLAVWIHTFVPGLPLSVLDHTLVHGNSLVGVGTLDEIRSKFEEVRDTHPMFAADADELLGPAAEPLSRLANVNDATLADIDVAREAMRQARAAVGETAKLCDLIAAGPVSDDERVVGFPFERWGSAGAHSMTDAAVDAGRRALRGLQPLHFPIAFPEVFLRERPGFDVILGNPPWREPRVQELAFWARHFPGLRGLSQREHEAERRRLRSERPDLHDAFKSERDEQQLVRRLLLSNAFPGMGTGNPDLYKAFSWRFWHLVAARGGRIGVVLPRSALTAKGSTEFRHTVFRQSERVDVVMLTNRTGWVFDEAEHRYTIGLICIARGEPQPRSMELQGPYSSLAAFQGAKAAGRTRPSGEIRDQLSSETGFDVADVLSWNDTASLPLLPSAESVEVFAQLRKAPRLDLNEIDESGGGGGAPVPTARWTRPCRSPSWTSTIRPTLARPSGRRVPLSRTKAPHDPRGPSRPARILARLQGRIVRDMES